MLNNCPEMDQIACFDGNENCFRLFYSLSINVFRFVVFFFRWNPKRNERTNERNRKIDFDTPTKQDEQYADLRLQLPRREHNMRSTRSMRIHNGIAPNNGKRCATQNKANYNRCFSYYNRQKVMGFFSPVFTSLRSSVRAQMQHNTFHAHIDGATMCIHTHNKWVCVCDCLLWM